MYQVCIALHCVHMYMLYTLALSVNPPYDEFATLFTLSILFPLPFPPSLSLSLFL